MRRWMLRAVAVAIGLVVAAVASVIATSTRQGARCRIRHPAIM